MNRRSRIGIAFVVLLLAMVFAFSLVQASDQDQEIETAGAMQANAKWFREYVHRQTDPPLLVGNYNSIAFSPSNHKPYISYYDSTNGDLMLATPVTDGSGNCGAGGNWDCSVVDGDATHGGDNVGMYNSLALWRDGIVQRKIGISYYDSTHAALKVAIWRCMGTICSWNIDTISDSDIAFTSIGRYTSMKFASNGTPQIAYYSTNILTDIGSLRYAYSVSDGGNCGEGDAAGKWECTTIDTGLQVGMYASLDLDNEDRVNFAYYDGALGNLKHATYWGFGGNCGDTEWQCNIVDGFVSDAGLYPSIKAPQAAGEKARIAYYDATTEKLRYAVQGSDGDCGIGWICLDVDNMGSSIINMGVALDLDQDGHPIIAYQQILDEFSHSTLRIARPYFVYEDGNFGNCGEIPPGYLFTFWRCNTLDGAGAYVYEADYVSLAVSPSNLAYVAYSESDDYYNVNSLKLASQRLRLFMPTMRK